MATSALALLDQTLPFGGGSDRLSKEILSILESNFLFGVQQTPAELGESSAGRVRVLSIDGGADCGALAAAALVRLERRLQELSGNPAARVADFFDVAAGSGAGGILAAALFARRMTAEQARDVVAKNRKVFSGRGGRGGGLFSSRPDAVFRKAFGDLTVRDAAKPLLIPVYDMTTAAPFVFSRADAVEAEAFDFPLWQVCAAACGVGPAEVASLDGRTRLRAAAAGCAGVANPTAVAVTHVLNNKREYCARPCCFSGGPSRINGVRREQSNQLHPHPGQRHCGRSDGGSGHGGAGCGVGAVPGQEADAGDQRRAAGRRGGAAGAGAPPEDDGQQGARGAHQAVGHAPDVDLVRVHAHDRLHQLLLRVALKTVER